MWSIALLINTSTWNEMLHNWKLICYVFLQLHVRCENPNKKYQDALLDRIVKIQTNLDICAAIKSTEPKLSESITDYNPFDYDDDHENNENFCMSASQSKSSTKNDDKVGSLSNKYHSKLPYFLTKFQIFLKFEISYLLTLLISTFYFLILITVK